MLRKKSLFPQANASPKTKPPPLLKAKIVTPLKQQFLRNSFLPVKKGGEG